jgi:hypothetical protein
MRHILLGLVFMVGTGCMNVQPIGPLAKMGGAPGGRPIPGVTDGPEPATVQASRPVPPALLITPGEVTPENASIATRKLMDEYDYDRKNLPAPSKTAEVSVYKGGVKQ